MYSLKHHFFIIVASSLFLGCGSDNNKSIVPEKPTQVEEVTNQPSDKKNNTEEAIKTEKREEPKEVIPSAWKEITEADGIEVEMKYASKDNFMKAKVYDCGRCFLRPEAVVILKKINKELSEKHGYRLKVFDCFRPQPYQERLWKIMPDPDYVTPPQKGSMHSRGLAVDLTIVDADGDELDMGTPFDFFGEEAHQDYTKHSEVINENRALLKTTMEKYGFKSIRTEWWHYSYRGKSYPLDAWVWACE